MDDPFTPKDVKTVKSYMAKSDDFFLKEFLNSYPPEGFHLVPAAIAVRCALRAVPYLPFAAVTNAESLQLSKIVLHSLRCIVISRNVFTLRYTALSSAAISAISDNEAVYNSAPNAYGVDLNKTNPRAAAASATAAAECAFHADFHFRNDQALWSFKELTYAVSEKLKEAVSENLYFDIDFLQGAAVPNPIRELALWENIPQIWSEQALLFRRTLVTLTDSQADNTSSPWLVWWEWYEPQIRGEIPWNLPLATAEAIETRIALGDSREGFWNRDPEVITREIEVWVHEARTALIDTPEIPAELDGPTWQLDSNTNLLEPRFTQSLQNADEIADMESQRPYLLQCANDLITELNNSHSNSAKQLLSCAETYRNSINKHSGALSIPEIYCAGVRLRNMHARIRHEVENEGMPDVAVSIGEAMDSVIGLHGPFILSTKRGSIMLERAKMDNRSKVQELAYKEKAMQFSDALRTSKILSERGKTHVAEVNAEIATGPHPERSTQMSEASNHNLLSTSATLIGLEYAKAAFAGTTVGQGAIGVGSGFINTIATWLLANSSLLIALAATSPEVLGWLPYYLNWLKAKMSRLKN